jgi:hypothetical protein
LGLNLATFIKTPPYFSVGAGPNIKGHQKSLAAPSKGKRRRAERKRVTLGPDLAKKKESWLKGQALEPFGVFNVQGESSFFLI